MSAEKDREPGSAASSQAALPPGAVFLSYASEDVAAAERIAIALRTAGFEVWCDGNLSNEIGHIGQKTYYIKDL